MNSPTSAQRSGIYVARAMAIVVALTLLAAPAHAAQQPVVRTIAGTVTDVGSGAPLPMVQVALRLEGDSATAAGTITDTTGQFAIRGIAPGRYELRFIRLGYAPVVRPVTVATADSGDATLRVGTIAMLPAAVTLEGVNVVAEQSAVVHAPDRDIYTAGSIAGAAGGAATDVLRGIPDLEVDINGAIRMHGQAPAIYINGREAPMTGESLALFLEQFAAENIQSVEVIANPSARYDAEGAGGIVNIVLKKDVGLGISGNAFVNGGTRGEFRGGGRATFQDGPFTMNGGASLGRSGDNRTSTELRQNLLADPITFLGQQGRSDRSSWSGNLDLGANYQLNPRTELNAEARVDRNVADAERVTRYTEMDANQDITNEYDLILLDDGSGRSIDISLELEHRFAPAAEGAGGDGGNHRESWDRSNELRVDVEYDRGGDLEERMVERRILAQMGELDPADELTWEEDRETESELAVGFDLARALGEVSEIELGYEGEFGWTEESRLIEDRVAGSSDPVSSESRGFVHRQTVHGGYLTLARQFGDFGAQLGARAELAGSTLELPGGLDVDADDHFTVFPSANLSYSFSEGKRVRLSYSMRVRRPSSNILNPINTSSDPLNRRVGNPGIEPQYTHSYMLNASWTGGLGYLRATPFIRRSINEWEQIRTVDDDGVATTTYENLGSTNSYGVSLTGSLRDFQGFGARVTLSGQRTDRNFAAVLDEPTPSSTRWSVRSNFDRDFGSAFSAQGAVTYNPARDLPQGRASSTLMTRLGARYRFLGRRASLNVNVTDPFDIYDSSIERSARGYIETGSERVSMRRLTLSLAYSFQAGGGQRGGGGRRGGR